MSRTPPQAARVSRRGSAASTSAPSTSVSASFATSRVTATLSVTGTGSRRRRTSSPLARAGSSSTTTSSTSSGGIWCGSRRPRCARWRPGRTGWRWWRSGPTVPRAATARPSRTGGRTDAMTAGDVVLPSGQQFEIALGDQRVVVVEFGGGLRTYAVGGVDVLDGYAADRICTSGRGQVLIPWPNRLEDGRYDFDGDSHTLPLNEMPNGNAIHGLVRWAAWAAELLEPSRVVLTHVVHPQPGYPFSLSLSIEYSLSDAGLTVRTTATNAGDRDCPYGCGAHPYLTAGTGIVDMLELRIPAGTMLESDERSLPTGSSPVAGSGYDFRTRRPIGGLVLDNAFTDLERDAAGIAHVELRDPASGAGQTLWMDKAYPYVMVFSGDPLPDVARKALAVEPMSCPPNAFRSGESLVRLAPGASHIATWGISV